jgi:hypothetical protein
VLVSSAVKMFDRLPFPFGEGRFPAELGAVVQRTVLEGAEPAREVIHTADNRWLVGDGRHDPNVPGACVATHIAHVIERNSSVASLAGLPLGQLANRSDPGEPWTFHTHQWLRDDEEWRP